MGAIMEKLMDWQLSLGPDIFIAEENVGSSPGDAAASAVSYTPRPHVLEECRAWLKSTFQ